MAKYAARYKCQLCGQLINYGNAVEMDYNQIPDVLSQVVKNQRFIGTSLYQAPMHIPHKCSDGSGGLACFCGLKKIQ